MKAGTITSDSAYIQYSFGPPLCRLGGFMFEIVT